MSPNESFKYGIWIFNFYGIKIYPGLIMNLRYIRLWSLINITTAIFSIYYWKIITRSMYEDIIVCIFLCVINLFYFFETNHNVKLYQDLLDKSFEMLPEKYKKDYSFLVEN